MSRKKSKSEVKREAIQQGKDPAEAIKDLEKENEKAEKTEKKAEKKAVKPVDVKYRVTFLADQMFKGLFRPKGTSAIVPASIAKAYKGRTTLKFEREA